MVRGCTIHVVISLILDATMTTGDFAPAGVATCVTSLTVQYSKSALRDMLRQYNGDCVITTIYQYRQRFLMYEQCFTFYGKHSKNACVNVRYPKQNGAVGFWTNAHDLHSSRSAICIINGLIYSKGTHPF